MDEFDLPIDQVRAILATDAGAEALWKSKQRPHVTVQCPDFHRLGRIFELGGVAALAVPGVRLHGSFVFTGGDQIDLPIALPPRVLWLNDEWHERQVVFRCRCRSWFSTIDELRAAFEGNGPIHTPHAAASAKLERYGPDYWVHVDGWMDAALRVAREGPELTAIREAATLSGRAVAMFDADNADGPFTDMVSPEMINPIGRRINELLASVDLERIRAELTREPSDTP